MKSINHTPLLIVSIIVILAVGAHAQSVLTGEAFDIGNDTYRLELTATGGSLSINTDNTRLPLIPFQTPASLQSFSIASDTSGADWFVQNEFLGNFGSVVLAPNTGTSWPESGVLKVLFTMAPGSGDVSTIRVVKNSFNGVSQTVEDIPVTPVPEPGQYLAATAIGLILFALGSRRKKASSIS